MGTKKNWRRERASEARTKPAYKPSRIKDINTGGKRTSPDPDNRLVNLKATQSRMIRGKKPTLPKMPWDEETKA